MKVKVECSCCAARFEFEVEPVNGRMPVAIGCPSCGTDATELANAVILAQSAPPTPGLRISKSHTATPAPAAAAQPVPASAPARPRPTAPVHPREKNAASDRPYQIFKYAFLAVLLLGIAAFGFWGWYSFFARNPEVVYSVPIAERTADSSRPFKPDEYFQLIGPGQVFSVKSKRANLFDVSKQLQVWSIALQTESEAAAAKSVQDKKNLNESNPNAFLSEVDYDLSNPLVEVTTNDIWLGFRDRVLRLDRQTGQRKEPTLWGRILSFARSDDALMAVYIDADGKRTLAHISLPDGAVQTAELYLPSGPLKPATLALAQHRVVNTNLSKLPATSGDATADKLVAASAAITRSMKTQFQTNGSRIAPAGAPTDALNEMTSYAINHEEVPPFTLAGQNVIQFEAKLLEQRQITRESVKPETKSVLDGNVTASQGLDLAQEMVNDAARKETGGVEVEDVSRFQVSLHRWFANDAPDWTGEVVGPPKIYSAKTVDLLVAGQSLLVFDKRNKKLWEGKLTYSPRLGEPPPFLETSNALYFADPGGLVRFDLATGNVRWRMDSVGISSLHADERGNLYLSSTTATPDHITHPHQVNLRDKIHPVLMKLNPETGQVIWRWESIGSDCFFSGKFFYATLISHVQDALKLEEGPDLHYNLRLLDPANGHEIWLYHKKNHPVLKTEVQGNWILLQYEDGVSVLKFFSL